MKTPNAANDAFLNLLQTAPANSIPRSDTRAYKLLALLASGEPVPEARILADLGWHYRSPLQRLMKGACEFWNIIPVYDDKGVIEARRLDCRHLSGDPMLDARARAERRLELARMSFAQSIHEKARTGKASAELAEADEHLKSLNSGNDWLVELIGELAANDPVYDPEANQQFLHPLKGGNDEVQGVKEQKEHA
ncbi:MAG: hypothetical protein ACRCWP_09195 [Shewanella sp.]